MGEVYRARDKKLGRDVALKVLPETFVSDPERVARFEREAKTLAALNHPNIGAIHGLEESSGVTALVLELVEGPTLADRIAQGAVPLDEALPIAKQLAHALEAAHEQGIIHRDLKPANIKVRADGTVKVLDFGLAKAIEAAGASSPSLSISPTITSPVLTGANVLLGTAAYMAPEQARGKPMDRRADIWAFGCVLFEMLRAGDRSMAKMWPKRSGRLFTRNPTGGFFRRARPRSSSGSCSDASKKIRSSGYVISAMRGWRSRALSVRLLPLKRALPEALPARDHGRRAQGG